jgi:hypothetical protein
MAPSGSMADARLTLLEDTDQAERTSAGPGATPEVVLPIRLNGEAWQDNGAVSVGRVVNRLPLGELAAI